MPELTPRVVFDCNLFVQGIANRNSPARKALRLFFSGDVSLYVSEPILREVRDVLNRAEIRRQLPGITDRIVNAFLTKLEAKAILIVNVPEEFHYERDPDDEMYINPAIVGNATYLVSRDKDLLDLMTTSTDIARRFRSSYPFLRIMTPASFIAAIESASAAK
ncbi:MAG TPA: putative toxin-antitoxin system toxin component, PIN family [Pyrinomonadaceae bacterium]|nr:putative toxin-antitoxin system toxin component, PIN family [Pyrinomonadaceae bacterium]